MEDTYLRDSVLIPGWERSPGGVHGNPLQYSCLQNLMERGAWWATIHRVTKGLIWLNWLSTQVYMGETQENWVTLQNSHGKYLSEVLSVQFISITQSCELFVSTWTAASQASLSITYSWSLLKLKSIESVMSSSHLILCCPLLLLISIISSNRVFSNESVLCIRWPKYWSLSISPSKEYSGLISFRIDWLDLLAIQGLSRVFYNTKSINSSSTRLSFCSNTHIHT